MLQRVQDEADLCRNEGASDIAALLDEVVVAVKAQAAEVDALKQTLHDEIDGNLRLRAMGGARPDETMTAFLERVIRERDAALAQPAAPAVPAGWKLVPVEPTNAMIESTYHGQPVDDIYRDMLAAAPEVP